MDPKRNEQATRPTEPFFARFLEEQEVLAVRTDVKAGRPPEDVTQKFPSDSDEGDI